MTSGPRLLERAKALKKSASTMVGTMALLDVKELVDEYLEMKEAAPRRGDDGFLYFVEMTGVSTTGQRFT